MAAIGSVKETKGLQHSGVLGDHSNQVMSTSCSMESLLRKCQGEAGLLLKLLSGFRDGMWLHPLWLAPYPEVRSQHTPLLAVSKEDAHLMMQITGCRDLYWERGEVCGLITAAIAWTHRVIGVYVWQSQRILSHRLRTHSMLAGNQVAPKHWCCINGDS